MLLVLDFALRKKVILRSDKGSASEPIAFRAHAEKSRSFASLRMTLFGLIKT